MAEEIQRAKCVSIATDAWTDINGQSVINFIVMTPKPVFYKALYTKNNSLTADYIRSRVDLSNNLFKNASIRDMRKNKIPTINS